jgi:hypothetical protein
LHGSRFTNHKVFAAGNPLSRKSLQRWLAETAQRLVSELSKEAGKKAGALDLSFDSDRIAGQVDEGRLAGAPGYQASENPLL